MKNPLIRHLLVLVTATFFFFFQGTHFVFHLWDRLWDTHDSVYGEWSIAWSIHALLTPGRSLWDAPMMHPMKGSFLTSETLLGNLWITFPVQQLFHNPVFTNNFLLFAAFVLTAYTGFLFLYELTQSYWGAFVGGILFSFNPYRWAHTVHLQLLTLYFFPLCLLFFTRFLKTKDAKSLFWTAILFCGQFYCCIYMAVTLLTLLTFLLLYHFIFERKFFPVPRPQVAKLLARKNLWIYLSGIGGISFVLVLPLAYQYLRVSKEWSFSHGVTTNSIYSCELFSFLSPTPYAKNYSWLKNWMGGKFRTGEEMNVFPGFTLCFFAVLGLVARLKLKSGYSSSFLSKRFFWASVFLVLVMMGPVLIWRDQTTSVPLLPYLLVYSVIPGAKAMRVPSRFNQPLLLCVSVLVAVGVQFLLSRRLFSGKLKQGLVIGAVFALIFLDYQLTPEEGAKISPPSEFPPVYHYLKEGDPLRPIVELPMFVSNPPYHFEYFQFQTLHWRPSVGSQGSFVAPATLDLSARTAGAPDSRALLSLAVSPADTIVIHPELYPEEFREKWRHADLSSYGFHLAKDFCRDLVWERDQRIFPTSHHLKMIRLQKVDEPHAINYVELWVQAGDRNIKSVWTYFTGGLVPVKIIIRTENQDFAFNRRVEFPTYLLPGETGIIKLGKLKVEPKRIRHIIVESPLFEGGKADL